MEENKRFRNHFTIIFERLGATFLALIMLFLYEGVDLITEIIMFQSIEILLIVLGVIVLIAIIVGVQVFRWSKTYISIQEQAIVIEVNTLKQKKNTIGVKNISNINVEQNLFERLVGTATVKMDTNSMSTADQTDVKIVLKKETADQFRERVLRMMGELEAVSEDEMMNSDEMDTQAGAGVEDMLIQGIFSLRLISIPLLLLSFIGVWSTIQELLQEGSFVEGILGALSSILIIMIFAISILWDIVKKFIQYYGFKICRKNQRLYISYGLVKKVSYTIPVDKINAVKLVQTPQARLAKRYMAELINVGMGDEVENEKSFFLLYDDRKSIQEKIEELLPEFAGEMTEEVYKQSPKVWLVWMIPGILYALSMAGLTGVLCEFFEAPLNEVLIAITGITVFVIICLIGNYFTRGYCVRENSLKIVTGTFGRETMIVKYPKIQFLKIKQNFVAKHFGIQKGELYLLASTKNRIHDIPYFPEIEVERIKESLLRN